MFKIIGVAERDQSFKILLVQIIFFTILKAMVNIFFQNTEEKED